MIFRLRRPMKWRIFENANLYNEIFRGGDLYYISSIKVAPSKQYNIL